MSPSNWQLVRPYDSVSFAFRVGKICLRYGINSEIIVSSFDCFVGNLDVMNGFQPLSYQVMYLSEPKEKFSVPN